MPKTPITYYGGKINLLKEILPLIPEHKIYTEPFFGGGAVFFAKKPAVSEVINDTNAMVVTFFEVCKTDFEKLKAKVQATPFSRATYSVAVAIYRMPHLFNKIQQAWAFYVGTNMGFSTTIGSWGYDRYGKRVRAFRNKTMRFNESIVKRLEQVQIEHNDAIKVIESRDAPDAFHYVDPPYIDVHQGHYDGYTREDYRRLLSTLVGINGKFLLSSYPNDILTEFTQQHRWYTRRFDKPLSASKMSQGGTRKRKVEVLTANYPI